MPRRWEPGQGREQEEGNREKHYADASEGPL
jgi:hypothetical protein